MVALRTRLLAGGLLASVAMMVAPVSAIAWADDDYPYPGSVADDPGPPLPNTWDQYGRDIGPNAAGDAADTGTNMLLSPILGPFAGFVSGPVGDTVSNAIQQSSGQQDSYGPPDGQPPYGWPGGQ